MRTIWMNPVRLSATIAVLAVASLAFMVTANPVSSTGGPTDTTTNTQVDAPLESDLDPPEAPPLSDSALADADPATIVVEAPTDCNSCHKRDPHGRERVPIDQLLTNSTHAGLSCDACHESIDLAGVDPASSTPHGEVEPVDCGTCHEDETEMYVRHGRLEVGKDTDLPKCWDCHGSHDIVPLTDLRSRVHSVNLSTTCQRCHVDIDLVKKHVVLRDAPIRMYQNSVHGRATGKGIYAAATCNDCHAALDDSGRRTAHRVLSPADPDSPTYHFNIPDTCGACHEPIARDYWEGIHGQYVKRGELDSPVCTTCHGEHGIIKASDPDSPVSAAHLAEQTCSPCHESARLNEKFGLAGGRLASYIDSYHGLKSKTGDVGVANCASCHGYHRILPSSDPTSSIHASNLRKTCGDCHPGITEELAQTKIHATGTGLHVGWPEFFRKLYIVIIVVTIGLMLLHNLGDWLRYIKNMNKRAHVQRLSTNEVMQHWLLMISFIVLVVSGFALRFSDAWWVHLLFGREGGFEVRGIVHRVAAVVMVFSSAWHMIYMLTARGRHWVRDMWPDWSDVRNLWHNILYFLGRRPGEAGAKRFSYMEKAEYWALVWGTIIMTLTGLFLWFDNVAVRFVPKGFLDVMLVIHYYEAWLATLAILVWHIYGTMFRPGVWPMNPAWLAGRMPKEMYDHEHPEGPRLKARISIPRYEEEIEENDRESISAAGEAPATVRRSKD